MLPGHGEQTTIGQELTGNPFWNRPAAEPAAATGAWLVSLLQHLAVPEYLPGISADFLAAQHAGSRRGTRWVRLHRNAGVRGHRGVRSRGRGVHRCRE